MSNSHEQSGPPKAPDIYTIRVSGRLSERWAAYFEGMCVTPAANGETLLTGPIADQAALYGLLRKVRDLGLHLIAVNRTQ